MSKRKNPLPSRTSIKIALLELNHYIKWYTTYPHVLTDNLCRKLIPCNKKVSMWACKTKKIQTHYNLCAFPWHLTPHEKRSSLFNLGISLPNVTHSPKFHISHWRTSIKLRTNVQLWAEGQSSEKWKIQAQTMWISDIEQNAWEQCYCTLQGNKFQTYNSTFFEICFQLWWGKRCTWANGTNLSC